MLKFYIPLLFSLILSACASPGFLGQKPRSVTVAGSTFKVYARSGSNRVEAHRVNMELLPSKVLILTKAVRAIEIATGCDVDKRSLRGDQAIVKARVNCTLP